MCVRLHAKCLSYLSYFNQTNLIGRWSFLTLQKKKKNFKEICTEASEFFHADKREDRYEEIKCRFSQKCFLQTHPNSPPAPSHSKYASSQL